MKSTLTYEMQNFEANQTTSVSSLTIHEKESSTLRSSNSGGEKYSLRQRQKPRIATMENLAIAADSSGYLSDDNSDQEYSTADGLKVAAKSKAKKPTTRKKSNNCVSNSSASTPAVTSTPIKAKTKAAPLSKYRRKTANARERTRMREINSAFENLRHCVPHSISGDESVQSNEKLTKITTLRLAMKYIKILNEALTNPSFEADFLLECKRDGDHRFTTHNWQQQPLIRGVQSGDDDVEELLDLERDSEPELLKLPATKTKPVKTTARVKAAKKNAVADASNTTNVAANTRKAPAKRMSKKQKLQQNIAPYNSHSSSASTCSSLSSSTLAYTSLSSAASSIAASSPPCSSASNSSSYLLDSPVNSAYINNISQSLSDLSSLILESDGESLHLSEPCLSPSNYRLLGANCTSSSSSSSLALLNTQQQQQPTTDTFNPYDQSCDQNSLTMSSLENPLELSLRLLDSSADTLDFGADAHATGDQHAAPSTCLSPLVTLDSFNPFADLLHSDFPEHSALDLFLT